MTIADAKNREIVPTSKTPEQIRSQILNAIGDGDNTIRLLMRVTGLDNATILREIDFMRNLYIVAHPGPPITSYWLKGKKPKGAVMIGEDGRAVAARGTAPKIERIAPRAAEIPAAIRIPENAITPPTTGEPVGLSDFDRRMLDIFNGTFIVAADIYEEEMPVDMLEPHPVNPRGAVDEQEPAFDELVDSIKIHGVQEPLIVTPVPGKRWFRIVIGHRRHRASIKAGKDTVRVVIRVYASPEVEEEVMLVENIQRQNLKPMQEARAFKRLFVKYNEDINEVARRTGTTQSYVRIRMNLLKLELGIQIMVDRGEIGPSAGATISALSGEQQLSIVSRIPRMKLDELKELVAKTKFASGKKQPSERKQKNQPNRVTTEEEKFTRSGAVRELESMGEAAWITVGSLLRAFDDVCVDTCLESKDESFCNGCPVPRMIYAITRRNRNTAN